MTAIRSVLLFTILLYTTLFVDGASSIVRAVPAIPPSEKLLHKYSAVLAAAESAKRQCALEIKRTMSAPSYLYHNIFGTDLSQPSAKWRSNNKIVAAAYSKYEKKLEDILKSCDMDVDLFNSLSERIAEDSRTKEAVSRQASNYRLAADLDFHLNHRAASSAQFPTSIRSPPRSWFTKAYRQLRQLLPQSDQAITLPLFPSVADSKLTQFCKAVYNIDELREQTVSRLKRKLGLNQLPAGLDEPSQLPSLCRPIRQAVLRFPQQAALVYRRQELTRDEFETMLKQTSSSVLFRRQVQNELRELEQLVDINTVY